MSCILVVKVFFCSSKSYLIQDNLCLKYIVFNIVFIYLGLIHWLNLNIF